MSSVDELLSDSALPVTEARALLGHALGAGRSWLIAHGRDSVAPDDAQAACVLFARRRAGEPVAYLIGEREFFSLSLYVDPSVLIPRPETELVVERALALIGARESPKVLDLGTGSGAIAVAIAHARPDAQVWASDNSAQAIAVATRNALRHGAAVRFVQGDWFAAAGEERFDLLAANPPYIAQDDPHLRQGDLRFEPRAALVGGADGMNCIRAIVAGARARLAPGGWLVLEHGHDQGAACVQLLVEHGYTDVADVQDLSGRSRVCVARFDAPPHWG